MQREDKNQVEVRTNVNYNQLIALSCTVSKVHESAGHSSGLKVAGGRRSILGSRELRARNPVSW